MELNMCDLKIHNFQVNHNRGIMQHLHGPHHNMLIHMQQTYHKKGTIKGNVHYGTLCANEIGKWEGYCFGILHSFSRTAALPFAQGNLESIR